MPRRAPFLLAAAAFLASSVAVASQGYPDAMKTDLVLTKAPGCDLCHAAATAPVGGVDTPFGKSIVAKGLVASDDASLKKSLDAMRAAGVDSDGDGAEDLDELSWGGDPNHADLPQGGNSDPITYGCSAGRVPVEGGPVGLALGAFAAALVRVAARRRRRATARLAQPRI